MLLNIRPKKKPAVTPIVKALSNPNTGTFSKKMISPKVAPETANKRK
jgi:hypothetical protein